MPSEALNEAQWEASVYLSVCKSFSFRCVNASGHTVSVCWPMQKGKRMCVYVITRVCYVCTVGALSSVSRPQAEVGRAVL